MSKILQTPEAMLAIAGRVNTEIVKRKISCAVSCSLRTLEDKSLCVELQAFNSNASDCYSAHVFSFTDNKKAKKLESNFIAYLRGEKSYEEYKKIVRYL